MTLLKKTLLTALIASAASNAFAGNTADLIVTGTITPVACVPAFVGGGVVDFGNISPTTLSRTDDTKLAVKTVNYTITCDAPIVMATRISDSRVGTNGTKSTYLKYGLGKAGGINIGGYNLTENTENLVAGGGAGNLISSTDKGASWHTPTAGKLIYSPEGNQLVAYAPTGKLIPAAYQTIAGKLNVEAVIGATAGFDFSQDIKLDGLATMEVVYL